MAKIAWIGTGVMGVPMAGHLAGAGHEMHLFNRTFAKAKSASEDIPNSKAFDNIKEAIEGCEFVMICLRKTGDNSY